MTEAIFKSWITDKGESPTVPILPRSKARCSFYEYNILLYMKLLLYNIFFFFVQRNMIQLLMWGDFIDYTIAMIISTLECTSGFFHKIFWWGWFAFGDDLR